MTLGKLGSGGDEQEQGGTGSAGGIDFRLAGSCQRVGSEAESPAVPLAGVISQKRGCAVVSPR